MPYISYNGQLYEITQAQYDSYTIGSPLPTGAVLTNAGAVASGGTVTNNNSVTTPILTENTTNNTPNQTLTTTSTAVITAAATYDITDPYIRARLGLPALSEVQTLSGAIANVNFGNVGNTVSNLVTSFGNTVGNISLDNISNTLSNVATSFGNAVSDINFSNIGNTISDAATSLGNSVSNIGDYFSGNTATTVADSAVNTSATATDAQATSTQQSAVAESQVTNADSTTVSTSTADAGSGTTVGTITDPVPASAVDTAPASVDYNAGLAGTDTTTVPASQVDTAPADVNSTVDPQASLAPGETIVSASDVNGSAAAVDPNAGISSADLGNTATIATDTVSASDVNSSAADVSPATDTQAASADAGGSATTDSATNTGAGTSSDSTSATAGIKGLVTNAQQQQTIADQRKQINNGDWRVRLRLAPQSNYLYNAQSPGIMQPLKVTDGIIFPYTPQIDTSYRANYESYDLTHSNYRGYFYKNSYVDAISLKAQFTAQDTNEANYLLAVITFLKSATKMFYGQDTQRGAPPPLVYLSGFGDYQFREHACVISQFQYNLPDNVDYIRAGSPNNVGLNLTSIRDRQSVATNSIFGSINRLAAAFLPKGGTTGAVAPPTLGLNRPTYVPTKLDINLTLFPMQSRQQISKQFSLKEFANGNLIKGGFW